MWKALRHELKIQVLGLAINSLWLELKGWGGTEARDNSSKTEVTIRREHCLLLN